MAVVPHKTPHSQSPDVVRKCEIKRDIAGMNNDHIWIPPDNQYTTKRIDEQAPSCVYEHSHKETKTSPALQRPLKIQPPANLHFSDRQPSVSLYLRPVCCRVLPHFDAVIG